MAEQDDAVIPAGSGVPVDDTGEAPNQSSEGTANADQSQQAQQDVDASALQKQVENLEKLIGRQSSELGELRQFKTQSEEAKAAAEREPAPDYEAQLADIESQLNNGDIDVAQAMRMTAKVSSEMATADATQAFENKQQQAESQKTIDRFMSDNPDFAQLRDDGVLAGLRKANPLHDDFSAYFQYKAEEATKAADDRIQAARTEGEQKGAAMAEQAKKAANVLGKNGAEVRNKNVKTSFDSPAERKQAMRDALIAAREQG